MFKDSAINWNAGALSNALVSFYCTTKVDGHFQNIHASECNQLTKIILITKQSGFYANLCSHTLFPKKLHGVT